MTKYSFILFLILIFKFPIYCNENVAILAVYKGSATLVPAHSRSQVSFSNDIDLQYFDRIDITEGSRIELRFPNNTTVRSLGNTTFEIDYDGIFVSQGSLWINTERNGFTIRTTSMKINISSGEIILEDEGKNSTNFVLYVLDGKVQFSIPSKDDKNREITMGTMVVSNKKRELSLYKFIPFNILEVRKKFKKLWGNQWHAKKIVNDLSLRELRDEKLRRNSRIDDELYKLNFNDKIFLNPFRNFQTIFNTDSRRKRAFHIDKTKPIRPGQERKFRENSDFFIFSK
jgi:hypothetical protein